MAKMIHKENRRLSAIIVLCVVMSIGFIYYIIVIRPQQQYYYTHHVNIHGVYLLNPVEINYFSLTDMHGKMFSNENLTGHWTLIYFGFTHCEMICPTTMDILNKFYQTLEKTVAKKNMPQVVFITIDPERDSQKRLLRFVTSYNSHFIGISGESKAITALQQQCHETASIVPTSIHGVNSYTFNHTSDILLVNRKAKIQAYFTFPPKLAQMVEDYQAIIKKFNNNRI